MSGRNSILLTGSSGFLGGIIQQVLKDDYQIFTLGRTVGQDLVADLSTSVPELHQVVDCVIHAAGKAHVAPRHATEVNEFYKVNVEGTRNLLSALEGLTVLPTSFIFISSIAVYGKTEGEGIDESHQLAGNTPYALSKIQAEQGIANWCRRHKITLTILRLPLLVGEHPPGNLGYMIRMMRKGLYIGVGQGEARKSMVLAEDVARFIPRVMPIGGTFNLTDGHHPRMREVEQALARALGRRRLIRLPYKWLAVVAKAGDVLGSWFPLNTLRLTKLDSPLTFHDALARQKAGWSPRSVIEHLADCV
jgi:GlcNAc-P-P-Und epimerase